MTNEELVALIQAGDRDKLVDLWGQVRRFVAAQARRRLVLSGGAGGVEFGDLYNAGYLALLQAVDTFRPDAGCSFIGWLALALKNAFAEAGGYLSRKQAHDPLHQAVSTDALAYDEDSETTVGDLMPDPAAVQAFEDVEARLYREQLHTALETALAALPAEQSATLRRRYYLEQTLDEIAAAAGVYKGTVLGWQEKGLRELRHPRNSRELRRFVEDRTPYYRN